MTRTGRSRRSARRALGLAAALLAGCTTTWAEIHGPRVGLGLGLDDELRTSPRLALGYHYLVYKDAMGLGAGGSVTYSPVTQWTEVAAEADVWMFPLLGFPLTPFTFRLGGAFHPEDGAALMFGLGLGGVLYRPPDACYPPLEGAWNGCPPGVYRAEDTVYPDMVSRVGYQATLLTLFTGRDDPDDLLTVHALMFDTTVAWFLLLGDRP
jgi:hypothetical protein